MHQVTVSRSKTLKGVYEPCPYNPIMTQRDYDAQSCCGHGKPVETQNGEWYMVYLCNRLTFDGEYGILGRHVSTW